MLKWLAWGGYLYQRIPLVCPYTSSNFFQFPSFILSSYTKKGSFLFSTCHHFPWDFPKRISFLCWVLSQSVPTVARVLVSVYVAIRHPTHILCRWWWKIHVVGGIGHGGRALLSFMGLPRVLLPKSSHQRWLVDALWNWSYWKDRYWRWKSEEGSLHEVEGAIKPEE